MIPEELLARWRRWMQAQGHSRNTIEARTRRIAIFADDLGVDPVHATAEDVEQYLASLSDRGLGRGTLGTYYSHLRAWFDFLVLADVRPDTPMTKVPAPRVPARKPKPLTAEQFAAVLGTRMHMRTRMMILLAAYQGLRVHEIAKMRGEDVDLLAGQLRVVGKGDSDRTLPLHAVVAEYAEAFPRRGWWFPAQGGDRGHIHGRSVSDIVGDVLRRAGVPTGSAHRLRHTYGTRLVANGVNIRIVQELLRHASLQTTQIYTGVTFDQQKDALAGLA